MASNVETQQLAGSLERFIAAFIDGLILSLINGAFFAAADDGGFISGYATLIGALYAIAFWMYWNGQTPGKKIMGIKIIKEDGEKVDSQAAILRYVGYLISGAVFMLGFIWILFDKRKQGWHDKIAKTLVVKA